MERPIGTSGFEPGVNEATRRALLDLDRRIRDGEGGGGGSGEGGGGDAGPHDHDYLPLAGGKLNSGAQITARGTNATAPAYSFAANRGCGMYLANGTGAGIVGLSGELWVSERLRARGELLVDGDLKVDGLIDGQLGPVPDDFWAKHSSGTVFTGHGMVSGSQGSYRQSITCNGYRNTDNKWTSIGTGGNSGATVIELTPNGSFHVLSASNYPTGSASNPPLRFQVTESGPSFRAMPSKTRTVDDVLERAETAEFPTEDDEGVVTVDGHDEVPLFEVVSALLAKVKELTARIEELES